VQDGAQLLNGFVSFHALCKQWLLHIMFDSSCDCSGVGTHLGLSFACLHCGLSSKLIDTEGKDLKGSTSTKTLIA
jgi:hypothetical protein